MPRNLSGGGRRAELGLGRGLGPPPPATLTPPLPLGMGKKSHSVPPSPRTAPAESQQRRQPLSSGKCNGRRDLAGHGAARCQQLGASQPPSSCCAGAMLLPHQCHAGAGCCSPLPVTAMWSHATWAEVQPVPFPGAQVIGTLFYALMPRYPQTRAAPMSGSGQRLQCGAVWDGTWPLHCFVLMAPEPGGSPALLQPG